MYLFTVNLAIQLFIVGFREPHPVWTLITENRAAAWDWKA